MTSASAKVTIVNMRGLHARAAAKLAETAARFEARTEVANDGTKVGGGSLMALLMLGAGRGCEVEVSAEGPDAEEAVAAITSLIEAGFGEDV